MSDVEVVPGDPASCSALGGALRRQAATLRERRTALWRSATGLPGWTGPTPDAFVERLRRQLADVDRMVTRLDDLAAAVQVYATDLAQARAQGRAAADFAGQHGLAVNEEGTVRPRRGPVAVEVALGRRAALPQVQQHVDAARAQAGAAASRFRRRTASSLQALRADAGRLGERGTAATEVASIDVASIEVAVVDPAAHRAGTVPAR